MTQAASPIKNAVRVLSENPPPRRKPWSASNAHAAHTKIQALESQLGIPHSTMIFNIRAANERLDTLESLAAGIAARPAAAPAQVAAPSAVQSPVAAAPVLSRGKKLAIARLLGVIQGIDKASDWSEARLNDNLDRFAFEGGLEFPGKTPDAELATTYAGHFRRLSPPETWTGMQRMIRSSVQQKINAILEHPEI